MFKKLLKIGALYWKGSDRKTGFLLLLVVLGFSLGMVYCQYQLTQWNQEFYDALQRLDSPAFMASMRKFGFIIVALIIVGVSEFYFTQVLIIRWRKWLTEYALSLWLHGGNFYFWNHLENKGDNPDQRIAEDVKEFVDITLQMGLDIFSQFVTLVTFAIMLWQLSGSFTVFGHVIPGFLLWASVAYALFGSLISHAVGRKIGPLNYSQQTLEADFRFSLVRVRENAESILLMNGSKAEERKLKDTYDLTLNNFYRIINEQKKLQIFTSFYSIASNIFSIVMAAPKLFAKEITLGQVFQISSAFAKVSNALSMAVTRYSELAHWASVINRLDGFFDSMDRASELRHQTEQKYAGTTVLGQPELCAVNLRLTFPGTSFTTTPLTFGLAPGHSMVVTGSSGVGKSTLLRVFSKIWPFFDGQMSLPEGASSMMITQKPYLPIGTLKDAIAYPLQGSHYDDVRVAELLTFCGLERFIPRLPEGAHWSQILSPGEQQRMAWVRAFLMAPQWLYLDEATSALDDAMQSKLYKELKKRLPGTTVVSVAHRGGVEEYHSGKLEITIPSF